MEETTLIPREEMGQAFADPVEAAEAGQTVWLAD